MAYVGRHVPTLWAYALFVLVSARRCVGVWFAVCVVLCCVCWPQRDKDAVYLEVFDATEVTQRWAAEYSEHMTFKYAELVRCVGT